MVERTVEGLVEALRRAGRDHDDLGWLGDRRVADTDGTVYFERLPGGEVGVSIWSRGEAGQTRRYPSEDAAVRAVAERYPEVCVPWAAEESPLRGTAPQRPRTVEDLQRALAGTGPIERDVAWWGDRPLSPDNVSERFERLPDGRVALRTFSSGVELRPVVSESEDAAVRHCAWSFGRYDVLVRWVTEDNTP